MATVKNISEFVNIDSALIDWINELESVTGLTCINVRNLKIDASISEIKEAWGLDCSWFRGYADTILNIASFRNL